ncbi:MAG: hypothetical protein AUG16_00855 [Thaumarchaeota archaeon 13_1_20CM_2_39_20]|nr:MAG: hypothetical protein AUI92_04845 [Thaumarchaeota archaeon 13_1_40CM_3_38_6]OLD22817.1 MAG: hypothetical protein AUI59_01020 [Thaumarchaeota archaeon 13_1_40CM_2_39_13_1]OLE41221.1 MAG: hypothetical protein AUG16_00855 [Thaumarchaeota archaeon 13_1_20CM_2_39_20]
MALKMTFVAKIGKVVGYGNPHALIISSGVLVLVTFFYIFLVGSYFHLVVSPLENRVNYHESFAIHIIDQYFDHLIIASGIVLWLALAVMGRARIVSAAIYGIIAIIGASIKTEILLDIASLISIPIVVSFLIYDKLATKKILCTTNLPINYFALTGIAIGFVGIIMSFAPFLSVMQKSMPIHDYAYEIFLLLSSLSPLLVFFIIMGSTFKLVMKKFIIVRIKNSIEAISSDSISSKTKILYLLFFMLLSLTITLVPHQPTINTDNQQVGSDSGDYVILLSKLTESNNPQEFIQKAFVISDSSDRPLSSLFLYAIVKISPANISYTIDHVPIILGPALVLVVFFFTREVTSNDLTSLLASFLTTVSFHTLIGIYSGIYANWIALIIGYLSFVFLVRFLKVGRKLDLVIYSVLLIFLVFTHAYTWTILALFTGIFLIVLHKLSYYNKKRIIILLIIVLSSVAIDVARSSLTGTSAGIESDVSLARVAGPEQVVSLWSNLTDTTQNYSGGIFSNFIILALGVYWLFRSNSRELSSIFMLVFLALGVLPILVGDGVIQSRMLYDIPFQIPAAIGLTYLKRHTNGILMIFPICIWLFEMSIRAVSNFHFVSPS